MIIHLNDKTDSVKENYIQSLVLLYMPCETFSKEKDEGRHVYVDAYAEDGKYTVCSKIVISDRTEECTVSEKIDESLKLQSKNLIGRTFISAAEKIFGYKSPWGILTGIRPAKLAADYLSELSPEQVCDILEKQYLVSPEKAKACVKVAENEMRLVRNMEKDSCSLYISIPFCPSKCRYCSFVSASTPRLLSMIPEYVDALCAELTDISETVRELGLTLKTIYIGGGTPAVLTEELLKKLLFHVNASFDLGTVEEFTFEAGRPDCITKEKLIIAKESGAGRISVNTQTTNDDILASVGRKHSFSDYAACMKMAKEIGFDCINTDLIAGLPGESYESFCKSVRDVIAEGADDITVHSFTLKRSSEYKTQKSAGIDSNSITASDMVSYSAKALGEGGYSPYYMYRQKNTVGNLDNTGYSLPGKECLYNIYMMGEYHTVFAAGAGAVTKYVSRDRTHIERDFKPKYPYEYLDGSKFSGFDKKFALDFYSNIY